MLLQNIKLVASARSILYIRTSCKDTFQ